MADTTVFC